MPKKQYTGPLIPRIRSADGFAHVPGESQNMVYHEGRKLAAHVLDEMDQLGTSWAARQYETTDGTKIRVHASRAAGQDPMVYVEAVVQPPTPRALEFGADIERRKQPEQELELTFIPPLFVVACNTMSGPLYYVLEPNADVPLPGDAIAASTDDWRMAERPAYVPEDRYGARCTSDGTDDPRFVVTGSEEREDGEGFDVFGYGGEFVGVRPDGDHYYIKGELVSVRGRSPHAACMDRTGERGLSRRFLGSGRGTGTQYLLEAGTPDDANVARYDTVDEITSGRRVVSESTHTHETIERVWDCDVHDYNHVQNYEVDGRDVTVTWVSKSSTCTLSPYIIHTNSASPEYYAEAYINWDYDPSTRFECNYTRRRYNRNYFGDEESFGSTYSGQSFQLRRIMYGFWASIDYTIDRFHTGHSWTDNIDVTYTDGDLSFAGKTWYLDGYVRDSDYEGHTTVGEGHHDLGDTHSIGSYMPDEVTLGYGCTMDWNCPAETVVDSYSSEEDNITPGHEYDVEFIEPKILAYVLTSWTVDGFEDKNYLPTEIYVLDELVLSVPHDEYRSSDAYPVTADACGVIRVELSDGTRWFGTFDGEVSDITTLFDAVIESPDDRVSVRGALRGMANTPNQGFPRASRRITVPI